MVVLGNPPYSVSSCNKNDYIDELMEVYKQDLNERNIQPLSDDYIKFIRMGESFIEKNNEGVLAYISNNSFLDGVIHRQMRKHLMQTFDKIYILDLHGNAKKKETSPDGSKDENVFNIQQGVSINIFVKTGKKNPDELAKVYHTELFGEREKKYEYLNANDLSTAGYKELTPTEPYYFFVPKDFSVQEEYDKGFKIDEMMLISSSGITTHHDNELVSFHMFNTPYNYKYLYRPFDIRYIDYDLTKVERARYTVLKHLLSHNNISLITTRQYAEDTLFNHVYVSSNIVDRRITLSNKGAANIFPLYLYEENSNQTSFFDQNRKPNLNMDIVHELEQKLGLTFTPEKEDTTGTFAPIDILDYIYGVLHSNKYRNKYKEFLKIDFPRIPYPENADYFFKVAQLGKQLREIHLLESPVVNEFITSYPVGGDNEVVKPEYKDNKVYINKTQYFDNVLEIAWNFYIGGYQPAQKWLKDRKGRILSYEDVMHYQKIIVALTKTHEIMQVIDDIAEV